MTRISQQQLESYLWGAARRNGSRRQSPETSMSL
jgi:hypothetical protein